MEEVTTPMPEAAANGSNENDESFVVSPTLKMEREKLSILFSKTVEEFQSKAKILDQLNEQRIQQQFLIENIDSESKVYLEIIMKYYKTFQNLTSEHIHTAIDLHNRSKVREESENHRQKPTALESMEMNEHKNAFSRNHENGKRSAQTYYSTPTAHKSGKEVDSVMHEVKKRVNGSFLYASPESQAPQSSPVSYDQSDIALNSPFEEDEGIQYDLYELG